MVRFLKLVVWEQVQETPSFVLQFTFTLVAAQTRNQAVLVHLSVTSYVKVLQAAKLCDLDEAKRPCPLQTLQTRNSSKTMTKMPQKHVTSFAFSLNTKP